MIHRLRVSLLVRVAKVCLVLGFDIVSAGFLLDRGISPLDARQFDLRLRQRLLLMAVVLLNDDLDASCDGRARNLRWNVDFIEQFSALFNSQAHLLKLVEVEVAFCLDPLELLEDALRNLCIKID